MRHPKLNIKTSQRGVERVDLYTDPDAPVDDGLRLLRRILPALAELDRRARNA